MVGTPEGHARGLLVGSGVTVGAGVAIGVGVVAGEPGSIILTVTGTGWLIVVSVV